MSSAPATHSRKTLGRQVSWTLPANVIYGACSLLVLVALSKLADTAEVGRYSLAIAITGPIFLFANLKFNTVLASDMRKVVWLSDYFTLRVILLAFSLVVVAFFLFLPGTSRIALVLVFVALAKTVEGISDLCCGVQQRIEQMDRIAISLMANGLLMTSAFSACYFLTGSLAWAAAGLLFARMLVTVFYDIPQARLAAKEGVFATENSGPSRSESRQDFGQIADNAKTLGKFRCDSSSQNAPNSTIRDEANKRRKALLMSAAPLGLTSTLIALTSNIPCYVIPIYFDEHMLGLFASVAIVRQAGSLIFRAVEQPSVPRLAKAIEERNSRQFWKVLLSICAAFLGIGLMGAMLSLAVGGQVLSIVFTPEYRAMGDVLALMTIATAIGQVTGMVESSLIAARVIAVQVPMHFVTVLTCVILSYVLIPRYELYGAVLAMSVCRFPFMIVGLLLLRQRLAMPRDGGPVVKQTIPTPGVDERKRAA